MCCYFRTVDNLLKVCHILKGFYLNYDIYLTIDKYNVRLLRFVSKTNVCTPEGYLDEFEIIIINDYEIIKNKKFNVKVNMKTLKKQFYHAMIEACGPEYKKALANYLNYKYKRVVLI